MQPLLTKNVAHKSNKNDRHNVADRAVVIEVEIEDLVATVLQVVQDKLVVLIPLHNALAVQPVVALDNPLGLHTVVEVMAVAVVMYQADMVEAVKADDPAPLS